ncbi:tripartite tricarboxylate transporter substrate binding protein [Alcaligenaceae bacterium]|nr:tripartite tricarboxylate transporter substrate binding protein [Alcaligenaceae bacterium]
MNPRSTTRRALLGTCVALLCAPIIASGQTAEYPQKPITMVVSAAAGGVVDITARSIQQRMGELLGTSIVIDNRPGAGAHIGNAVVAKAVPDGYTILASAGSVLVSGVVRNISYDPIKDLTPIGMVASSAFILVVPANSPFKTLDDMVAYGKAHPNQLNFGSTGVGNSTHIGAEMLSLLTGMKATHVPYKGSAAALTDLIGGRIDFLVDNKASSLSHIRSGALRALGVTSPGRSADLPDVPAIGEVVPGYEIEGWTGLFAPGGTDPKILQTLSDALKRTLEDPVLAAKVSELVGEARYLSASELLQYMERDRARLGKVVTAANITVD